MPFGPLPVESAGGAFLLGFPALFSVINPLACALIFYNMTRDRSHAERRVLARRVATYAFLVLLGSMLVGGYVLTFFGVSLGALRVAGGLVVAVMAWGLLNSSDAPADRADAQAGADGQEGDIAFFPLTSPLTTGPGSISVAIALASQRPADDSPASFFVGLSLAALANGLLIWAIYASADAIMRRLGEAGARVVSRAMAFILLCIGIQIMSTGIEGLARPWLAPR